MLISQILPYVVKYRDFRSWVRSVVDCQAFGWKRLLVREHRSLMMFAIILLKHLAGIERFPCILQLQKL